MAKIARILLGPYGNGKYGLKSSLYPFDVSNTADDNDPTRRSFDSNWLNLLKLKKVGVAMADSVQFQTHVPQGAGQESWTSGWNWVPAQVATGLNYMPIWEERRYDSGSKIIYDDKLVQLGSGSSFSGSRSYFATTVSNTIIVEPYLLEVSAPFNQNLGSGGFPAFPPKPVSPLCLYMIWAYPLGTPS